MQKMFRGVTTLSLDSKGRLAIPAQYRAGLQERCAGQLVATVNNTNQRCLWLYPLDEWVRVEQKVSALPDFDRNHQKLKRFFIGHASDVEMDKNGRLLLPAPLREFATMEHDLVLTGQGNKFELWSAPLWNAEREQWLKEDIDMQNISAEMEQLAL